MRLTKGQLKRIIREEYSRLKRNSRSRRSLRENSQRGEVFNRFGDYISSLYDEGGEEKWVIETLAYVFEEAIEEVTAEDDEDGYGEDPATHVRELLDMNDPYTVASVLCDYQEEVGGSCEWYCKKFMKMADDELGGI
jgi:hypothetical protein